MPPQHHLPPPSYHHFSPLTNVIAAPPHKMGRNNQYRMPHQLEIVCGSSSSKRKCIPLKPPIPSKFQGDVDKFKDAPIPEFNNLVNFPGHMSNKPSPNVPEGMRCCVMCGQACPCSMGGKKKKDSNSNNSAAAGEGPAPLGDSTGTNTNKSSATASSSNNYATIPTQNKGLCTICDVNVWIVTASGLEIKWCKGCKNYRPWAAFGDKGLATKCVRCRERQREKYALQKEEKEKLKAKQHQMKKDRDKQQQQVVF
jgi:Zn-finger nucleic acid-binding protein